MMKNFSAVLPYSTKGKVLIKIIATIYRLIGLFYGRKWQSPKKNFEENPREGGILGAIYLGYKYYWQPHIAAEKNLEQYFKTQRLDFQAFEKKDIETEITINVGGDLMPYEWIKPAVTQRLWDDIGEWFFGADLVIANLETPIDASKSPSCVPELMLSNMYFNGSAEMFDIFSGIGKYKGYDLLCTANNHSLDMGEDGIVRTMDFLEEKKIPYVGTSRSAEAQQKPVIIEKKGVRIAFIAWTSNLNQLLPPEDKSFIVNYLRINLPDIDIAPLVAQAKAAREAGADIIITMLHTGNAYQTFPSAHTVDNFHRIFEQTGSDVILGYHPHNPQPMEKFTFTDPFSFETKEGFAIE